MYEDVHSLFDEAHTKEQHDLVENSLVLPNILDYRRELFDGLDDNPRANVFSFYSDFSKVFDLVPLFELSGKNGKIGIVGCPFDLSKDYLIGRQRYVKSGNTHSKCLARTSGVLQGSIMGLLGFFSSPMIYLN